jgi:ATP-binding cassette subfamily C protein
VPIEFTHGFTFKGHVGRGPSGSGKSTLARALVGVRPRLRGKIKLDKAALERWSLDALGKHIG